jgi:phosphatidylglycerophosphatase A
MKPDVRFLLADRAHFVALGFGSGLAPVAPGTFGTLAGLLLFWPLAQAFPGTPALLVFIGLCFILGIWACARTGRTLGVADHGSIVWDEMVAMWLLLAFTPASCLWWLAAFALFRFFDILKPWPIRWFDARIKNGFGVMFDDFLAALYALLFIKGGLWLGA